MTPTRHGTERAGEIPLAVLVGSALAAMMLVDGVEAVAAVVAILPCVVAPWIRERLPPWRGWLVAVFAAVMLVVVVQVGSLRENAVGVALVVLMLQQRLAPAEHRSDRLSVLLSVLLMVGAAARTDSVLYLPLWVAMTAALPLAVWRPIVRRSTGAVVQRVRAGMAACTALLASVLFFLLPRAFIEEPTPTDVMSGFASRVDLGSFHHLNDDPTLVAEVHVDRGALEPMRLRGAVLDRFDGQGWTSTAPMRPLPMLRPSTSTHTVTVSHLEMGGAVLVAGEITELFEHSPELSQDVSDAWRTEPGREVAFAADVVLGRPSGRRQLMAHERSRYLALPERLDPRVTALAKAVVGAGASPTMAAARIERHLQAEYAYARTDIGGAADPLADFLFGQRRGHCEYFATAATVLLRSAGVPARLVTGFAGGEPIPSGVRMRGTHAHAWTEVHLDGSGWVAIDGTGQAERPVPLVEIELRPDAAQPPPARPPRSGFDVAGWWREAILGHDRARQVVWAHRAASLWEQLLAIALVGMGILVLRRAPKLRTEVQRRLTVRGHTRAGVAGCLDEAMALLGRRGFVPPSSLPPVDAAHWVVERAGSAAEPLVRLAWLHYESRYGEGADAQEEARRIVAELRRV